MSVISKKICLIGDFGVGKTSLIRRFVEHRFSEQYLSTIGVTISRKQVFVSLNKNQEKQTVQLLIWDIEGRTQFQKISSSYLKATHGVIIVADYSRPETLENIPLHLDLVSSTNPQGVKLSIVLNKADLIDQDTSNILRQKHQSLEQFQAIPLYETSAKNGQNVEQLFHNLAESIIKQS